MMLYPRIKCHSLVQNADDTTPITVIRDPRAATTRHPTVANSISLNGAINKERCRDAEMYQKKVHV